MREDKVAMERLVVEVKEIKGTCPVYKVGDRIVLEEGYRLNPTETRTLCMHSLSSVMPYYNALFNGVSPVVLGLAREGDRAYVQCLDPCERTGGGTVVFEIRKESQRASG